MKGLIARTTAADASKEEFFHELDMLKKQYEKVAVYGRNRTCFSLLYESEPFYLSAVRDIYGRDLDEIVTDISEMHTKISIRTNSFHYISCIVWKAPSMKSAMKKYG